MKSFGTFFSDTFSNHVIYVTQQFGNCVTALTSEGDLITAMGSARKKDGQFSYPRGIAIDQYGVMYVCDNNNDRICMY